MQDSLVMVFVVIMKPSISQQLDETSNSFGSPMFDDFRMNKVIFY